MSSSGIGSQRQGSHASEARRGRSGDCTQNQMVIESAALQDLFELPRKIGVVQR